MKPRELARSLSCLSSLLFSLYIFSSFFIHPFLVFFTALLSGNIFFAHTLDLNWICGVLKVVWLYYFLHACVGDKRQHPFLSLNTIMIDNHTTTHSITIIHFLENSPDAEKTISEISVWKHDSLEMEWDVLYIYLSYFSEKKTVVVGLAWHGLKSGNERNKQEKHFLRQN